MSCPAPSTTTREPPRPLAGARLLHTMLRVRDLDASLAFYVDALGMHVQRRQDFADGRFTLVFVGYADEASGTVLELTHNWDGRAYTPGTGFGHVAIGVADVAAAAAALAAAGTVVTRAPGPLRGDPTQHIAFVADPDGYAVELIERRGSG